MVLHWIQNETETLLVKVKFSFLLDRFRHMAAIDTVSAPANNIAGTETVL